MMETTVHNTVGIRPLSVRMETTVRIETPVRVEVSMQMFKTSDLCGGWGGGGGGWRGLFFKKYWMLLKLS